MKKSLTLIAISLVGVCLSANAQDATDFPGMVYNLSRINNGGSARTLGLGGAQTAIGGDISSASSNPAGLGFFNRSEVSFSTQFNNVSSSTNYLGNTVEDSKLNLNLPNLGAVIKMGSNKGKWKSQSLGISINRMGDFQNTISYRGVNPSYDLTQFFVEQENFVGVDDFTSLAFEVGLTRDVNFFYDGDEFILIDGIETPVEDVFGRIPEIGEELEITERNYINFETGDLAFPSEEFPVTTQESIDVRGASSQFSISYGANYDDKIYIGAGIGITSFSQDVERILTERPTSAEVQEIRFTDQYEQDGIGINGTLGIIARPVDIVLLGLSYTTPTYYSVSQIRELDLSALYDNNDFLIQGLLFPELDYNITTPSRLRGGATVFFNKNGFITGEVEYVDYGGGNLSGSADGDSFDLDNQDINEFNQTFNYKIGAEYRYDIFRFRGGFAHISDPFNDDLEEQEQQISFGAGIRKQDFYVDLAVVSINGPESLVSPYPFAPFGLVDTDNTRVTVTVGFTF